MEVINKVAIITGGFGGIGIATVQHLLRSGIGFVAILDVFEISHERVIDVLSKLEAEFQKDRFEYYPCNVRNIKEYEATYDKVFNEKKYVDILVNNAGVARDKDIDLTIDVNFRAVVHGSMMAVDRMSPRKGHRGGVIVNVASFLGLTDAPLAPVYGGTKHAIVSFVRSMKEHNERLGVRIVCVCPGVTKTPMIEGRGGMFDFVYESDAVKEVYKAYQQSPDNVASAIVEIIKSGKGGDVWLSQNDQPAYAIELETDLEKMRIVS